MGRPLPAHVRQAVVVRVLDDGRSAGTVARESGVSIRTIRRWVAQERQHRGTPSARSAHRSLPPAPKPHAGGCDSTTPDKRHADDVEMLRRRVAERENDIRVLAEAIHILLTLRAADLPDGPPANTHAHGVGKARREIQNG